MVRNTQKIETVTGRGIPLRGDEIDTDRIIPARYLKCVTFEGIGRYAFYDERFDEKGNQKNHPFNDPRYGGGSVLLVNRNFGCGSSREHAPQSLMDYGVRAFIGESFAEIFAGNCTALGLPAVTVPHDDVLEMMEKVEADPNLNINIDIKNKLIGIGDGNYSCALPESTHKAFLLGKWDSTELLLSNLGKIESTAKSLPYLNGFPS